jgi:hypothetical protein
MQKRTRSILEELESLYVERDRSHLVESRANNVISSAIRLMEFIDSNYSEEDAEILNRKLLNAIRSRDPRKFERSLKRTDEDQ